MRDTTSSVSGRIANLQQAAAKKAAFVNDTGWFMFQVVPTCPPSKQVLMRGGRIYAGYNFGWAIFDDYQWRAYTVPDLTADLADPASVTTEIVFTMPGYYQLFLLELKLPAVIEQPARSDWSFYLHGTGDEFATSAEAEAWLQSETFQKSSPWYHGEQGSAYPLCGLVLKNNGAIGAGCNILPVDVVNRGRSYIWPRDMRPLTSIYD